MGPYPQRQVANVHTDKTFTFPQSRPIPHVMFSYDSPLNHTASFCYLPLPYPYRRSFPQDFAILSCLMPWLGLFRYRLYLWRQERMSMDFMFGRWRKVKGSMFWIPFFTIFYAQENTQIKTYEIRKMNGL